MYVMHKLFKVFYAHSLDEIVDEDSIYQKLDWLTSETPEHEIPDFRSPLTSAFWSTIDGSEYTQSATRNEKDRLFNGL